MPTGSDPVGIHLRAGGDEHHAREKRIFRFKNHVTEEHQDYGWRQQDRVDQGKPLPSHVHEDSNDEPCFEEHESRINAHRE